MKAPYFTEKGHIELPYFNYRGIYSLQMNAIIAKGGKSAFNSPARDVDLIDIPGRNGALMIDNGRYSNYTVQYKLILMPKQIKCTDECSEWEHSDEMTLLIRRLKEWLQSNSGYYELWDSYDPDYFRYAGYLGGLDVKQEIESLGEVTVKFTCKPFRYSWKGQQTITLTAPDRLYNYEYWEAQPYIKIYGSGDITLTVNSQTFNLLSVDEAIEIDSELMEVYNGEISMNDHWESDGFPSLLPGENEISWSGNVSKVEIIPRWRTL